MSDFRHVLALYRATDLKFSFSLSAAGVLEFSFVVVASCLYEAPRCENFIPTRDDSSNLKQR